MPQRLPVYDSQDQTYRVTIAGVDVVVRLRYLERPAAWYLDLGREASGAVTWIVTGRRLVKRYPLLLRDRDTRLPQGGDLYVVPTGAYDDPLTEQSLIDGSHRLGWWTTTEIAALQLETTTLPAPTIVVP